jgi:XRE family aerobic/anaerobic benzoate catabolism transcriptional regulator
VLDLTPLGLAIREARQGRGLTIKACAQKSGLSQRFLSDLERGQGNISISKLVQLARALGLRASDWVAVLESEQPYVRPVALIGLRGAGKSTVGAKVAKQKDVDFVELDKRIAAHAGLPLSQIFEIHGEAYYRRLEREILETIIVDAKKPVVIAVSGGIVSNADNWSLLKRYAKTVWLKARPEQHYERVMAQGDFRPMHNRPAAMSELRAILSARTPYYAQSECMIDTAHLDAAAVVDRVLSEAYPQ